MTNVDKMENKSKIDPVEQKPASPPMKHMPIGGAVCFFIILWVILAPILLVLQVIVLPFKILQALFCCNRATPLKIDVEVTECEDPSNEKDEIFFIHGWPDSMDMWDSQVKVLSKDYRCIRMTAPNFGKESNDRSWGCDFPVLISMISEAIKTHSKKGKVTIMCHDFGCMWTFLLQQTFPQLVSRVVVLDIGGTCKMSCGTSLGASAYQWFIVLLWFLGEPFGGCMSRAMSAQVPRNNNEVRPQMGYPYWYKRSRCQNLQNWNPDTTDLPILYFYGNKKAFYFHDQEWLDFLTSNSMHGCQFKEYDCDHWINHEKEEEFNKDVSKWLLETNKN